VKHRVITVTKRGKPVATLRPVTSPGAIADPADRATSAIARVHGLPVIDSRLVHLID